MEQPNGEIELGFIPDSTVHPIKARETIQYWPDVHFPAACAGAAFRRPVGFVNGTVGLHAPGMG
jgi:hypothetical protein